MPTFKWKILFVIAGFTPWCICSIVSAVCPMTTPASISCPIPAVVTKCKDRGTKTSCEGFHEQIKQVNEWGCKSSTQNVQCLPGGPAEERWCYTDYVRYWDFDDCKIDEEQATIYYREINTEQDCP